MDKSKSGGTGLETHVAGTLAYVGGWVSGLIFLLVEKNDRVVRFHAMQSIIVFGFLTILIVILSALRSLFALTVWNGALMPVSLIFTVLWALAIAFGIVLWLLLMIRTYHKQQVLVPVAGDLAFWMMERFGMQTPERDAMAFQGLGGELPRADKRPRHVRWEDGLVGRAVGSIAVIVWSIFLFVMFNYYADYIAYYHSVTEGGVTQLLRYPILTADLSRVLPVLNASLALNVLGHLIALTWNRYLLRQAIEVVVHAVGVVVALVFLKVFPFDYSEIPIGGVVEALPTVTVVILVLAVVGGIVETIVHLVRLITGIATR
jgi:uncharacterized membrane protein